MFFPFVIHSLQICSLVLAMCSFLTFLHWLINLIINTHSCYFELCTSEQTVLIGLCLTNQPALFTRINQRDPTEWTLRFVIHSSKQDNYRVSQCEFAHFKKLETKIAVVYCDIYRSGTASWRRKNVGREFISSIRNWVLTAAPFPWM